MKTLLYICKALETVYDKDSYLIVHKAKTFNGEHVSERSIVFRFGFYLQQMLQGDAELKDYSLDCEYNRRFEDIKAMRITRTNSEPKLKIVIPDMILHKRGVNTSENNLMVIEFKGWWNNRIDKDIEKLKSFTDQNKEYRYQFGYFICFGKTLEEVWIKTFINGEEKNSLNLAEYLTKYKDYLEDNTSLVML